MQALAKIILALMAIWAMPIVAEAQFTFTSSNGAITITGYTGTNSVVIIPDTINGLPVTSIQYVAFSDASVTSVTIPNSVIDIGSGAFQGCSSLTNVIMGTNVTTIESFAFYACTSLTSITIPGSVTNIAGWGFNDCPSLMAITVDTNNPAYCSVDGVLYDKLQTMLLQYPGGKAGSFAIPNSVTNIADGAFFVCTSLTNVIIPSSITSIGVDAFENCYSLVSVTIPDSVTSIGEAGFADTSLRDVTIPNHVTSIGSYAFSGCGDLSNVMIPDSVASIGDYAFSSCGSLSNILIPGSVTSIGKAAFGLCGNLAAITVYPSNSAYCSVDGVLFNQSKTEIVEFPSGKGGSYTIPNSVTSIGTYAFFGCGDLINVTIGNSVTSIGDHAFFDCGGLTNVTIGNRVASMGRYDFFNCTNLYQAFFQGNAPTVNGGAGSADSTVFFRTGAGTVYYVPGTTGWGATFGGWPTAEWYQPQPQILASGYGLSISSNDFQFTISWATNTAIVVEASTNLQNWTPVVTNALIDGTNIFRDPIRINYPQRFYRVRSQ